MSQEDPGVFRGIGAEDFVITRKRKKFRFARFNEFPNCFHLAEWQEFIGRHPDWRQGQALVVEVGAGSAQFLLAQARLAPEKVFVAVDIKGDRLYRGARDALAEGIQNIYFVRTDIAQISEAFASHSVQELWLTFSDPFPRQGDAKRRLTSPRFLLSYSKLLAPKGVLRFKTDNVGLFKYSLESLQAQRWQVNEATQDLHASGLSEEYKVMTDYEKRFVGAGQKISFLSAQLKKD